jgi:CDP-diacylglycerol--serine O-phosphatidyltransferase
MSIKSQIPNAFTLSNLLCGILIIIVSFKGLFTTVIVLAAAALIFDFLDGSAARALKVRSTIGKDLDSLADMVSFGVAPAIVLYNFWLPHYSSSTLWLPFMALLPAIFAAYRLAVFNNTEQSSEYFLGLATPALAIFAFSIPLASYHSIALNFITNSPWLIIVYSLLGSYLLLSPIKFLAYKLGSADKQLNRIRLISIGCFVLIVAFFKFFGIILCLLLYLVISLTIQKRLNTL